jgi:maleate isomerase
MAPAGIQFLVTRLPFARTGVADDHALIADVEVHARLVADADPALIVVNCTAAGVIAGPDEINRRVTEATGRPAVTTAQAVLAALGALGGRRVALVTPYPDDVVAAETAWLAAHGYEVVVSLGPACSTPIEQAQLSPRLWVELARAAAEHDVDVLLFSCAGIRIADVIGEIEGLTGRPVVTSNQALLWLVLDRLGVADRPTGFGRLLVANPPAALVP